jgi:hypothetical protein
MPRFHRHIHDVSRRVQTATDVIGLDAMAAPFSAGTARECNRPFCDRRHIGRSRGQACSPLSDAPELSGKMEGDHHDQCLGFRGCRCCAWDTGTGHGDDADSKLNWQAARNASPSCSLVLQVMNGTGTAGSSSQRPPGLSSRAAFGCLLRRADASATDAVH